MKMNPVQDESLRQMVRSLGPQGALAVLAFGYRAVQIWREEFPVAIPSKEEYKRISEERKNAKKK